jgi:tetrapyrrole methylase family protein / MazG family protein
MKKKTDKKNNPDKTKKTDKDPFQSLVAIMERLRSEKGCPWDREQTRESLKPYLIEETYEVLEALDKDEPEKIKEELGDLLFQILFHAQVAREQGEFDINDVITSNIEKMIHRHPHVFADKSVSSSKEVLVNWEEIKKNETKNRHRKSILDGVPAPLPALLKAHRIQEKAARVGFDWDDIKDVISKVDEELGELKKAVSEKNKKHIEEEIGDLIFAVVNLSRFVKVNPEEALRKCIDKFKKRFNQIETELSKNGKKLKDTSLEDMDEIWNRAKKKKNS